MMRVAVIGSSGQLGSDLVGVLRQSGQYDVIPLAHSEIEVTDPTSVRSALTEARPHAVINCAAFVRVDAAEDQVSEALRVNAQGALEVARSCAELSALCVYVSTECVFDGQKGTPYTEDDCPHPVNVYGATKLAGEFFVQQSCERWLIVRTGGLFGVRGARSKGGNFVETILTRARQKMTLRVVTDVRSSPAYAKDVAAGLEALLRHEATGLVHLANDGACSWYDFARTIIEFAGLSAEVQPVTSKEYGSKARRPADAALTSIRAHLFGLGGLRHWHEALRAYLVDAGHVVAGV